jgi:hypothetical protein
MPRKPKAAPAPSKKVWSPAPWPPLCLLASLGGRLKVLSGQINELIDDSPSGMPTWRLGLLQRSVDELRTIHAVLSAKMGVKGDQSSNGSEE